MTSLSHQFVNALTDSDLPPPKGIVDFEGEVSEKRFAVYRNNVMVSLIEALKTSFPTILSLVGEEFFIALAKSYIVSHPPKSPLLYLYGDAFETFLNGFEPVAKYPYMGDVAKLEYERVLAYHALDAKAITGDDFQNVPQDQFGLLRFKKHPAVYIQHSSWPIVSILIANHQEGDAAAKAMSGVDLTRGEDALVVRPEYQVDLYGLQIGEFCFYKALFDGLTLDEAVQMTLESIEENNEEGAVNFDLQNALSKALTLGLFSQIITAAVE